MNLSSSAIVYHVAGVVVAYHVLKILRKYIRWFTTPLNQLPGPKRSFLVGTFFEILKRPFMDPHREWWEQAGKAQTDLLHYTSLLGSSTVLVFNADHLKKIFMANYTQPRYLKNFFVLQKLLGKGLVTLEGKDWHRHRRIIHPSFQVGFLKTNMDQHAPSRIARLLESWKKAGPTRAINVYQHFSNLTLDILGMIAFAHDFQGLDAIQEWAEMGRETTNDNNNNNNRNDMPIVSDTLIKSMTASMRATPKRVILAALGLNVLDLDAARTRRAMNDAVARVVNNARQRYEKQGQSTDSASGSKYAAKSVLEVLLDAKDTNAEDGKGALSNQELEDEVKTFLLAGHETTSTWCYWAVFCLCQYPDIQERVFQDILKHSPSTGEISLETSEKMTYLDAFMKEVLRMHPPVGMLIRHTSQEETFGKDVIPSSTRLVIPVHLLHSSPRYWKEDPDRFLPERWLQDSPPYTHAYAYLPFSHGPRNCIGYRFATMEAKMIMSNILQYVRFELIPELRDTQFTLTSYITVKAKPTFFVNAKFRE